MIDGYDKSNNNNNNNNNNCIAKNLHRIGLLQPPECTLKGILWTPSTCLNALSSDDHTNKAILGS